MFDHRRPDLGDQLEPAVGTGLAERARPPAANLVRQRAKNAFRRRRQFDFLTDVDNRSGSFGHGGLLGEKAREDGEKKAGLNAPGYSTGLL
jgi:hypothetical protein